MSVGITHVTAEFAVATIQRWWTEMGRGRFPQATELLITADGGGSNSVRARLWKVALQRLADATGLTLTVCHFPPGTSKWNKIEHRLFSFVTQNWRGKPLVTVQAIVELIGSTRTTKGLVVKAALDVNNYRSGKKVSNDEWASPADPDSRIAKMKDGTTHLAYKAEHGVDLGSNLVLAAEVYHAD